MDPLTTRPILRKRRETKDIDPLGLVDEFQKWVTLESNGHRNCCSKRIIIFRF